MNAESQLDAARKAWQDFCDADGQVKRLEGFAHRNTAMQADLTRWCRARSDARSTLSRVLRQPDEAAQVAA
jgi:hypothetical protein